MGYNLCKFELLCSNPRCYQTLIMSLLPQIIVDITPNRRGKYCGFWRLDAAPGNIQQYGVKGYKKENQAAYSFKLQKHGYDCGVAPPVGRRVQLCLSSGELHPIYPYGFETGVCIIIKSKKELDTVLTVERFRKIHAVFPRGKRRNKKWPKLFTPSRANDIHTGNFGYWQGQVVCVDWY